MATAAQEAERQVIAARQALGGELDELSAAARSAVDIPAKIRHNPVQTAALAGGAGFLALGGPKRVLRAVVKRVRPQRQDRHRGLLPDEVERAVKHAAGPRAPRSRPRSKRTLSTTSRRRPSRTLRPMRRRVSGRRTTPSSGRSPEWVPNSSPAASSRPRRTGRPRRATQSRRWMPSRSPTPGPHRTRVGVEAFSGAECGAGVAEQRG